MGTTSSNVRGALLSALAAFIGSTLALAGGDAYLPRIGPVAMRFQAAHPQDLSILPPLPKNASKASEKHSANDAGATPPPSDQSNLVLSAVSYPVLPDSVNQSPMIPGPMYGGTNPAFMPPTANDLLPISPQMMVEYFRPGKGSNSAGASVFVPLNFTPATPAPVAPSSATYRTQ